jgi:hypothetical protein
MGHVTAPRPRVPRPRACQPQSRDELGRQMGSLKAIPRWLRICLARRKQFRPTLSDNSTSTHPAAFSREWRTGSRGIPRASPHCRRGSSPETVRGWASPNRLGVPSGYGKIHSSRTAIIGSSFRPIETMAAWEGTAWIGLHAGFPMQKADGGPGRAEHLHSSLPRV